MASSDLTAARLRDLFCYDPCTGEFTRLSGGRGVRPGLVTGVLDKDGYRTMQVAGRLYYLHRLVWLYMTGAWPQAQVDHRDGVRSNNRFDNLREATQTKNSENQRKAHRDSASGLLGVYVYRKKTKAGETVRFLAHIGVNGKLRHLGSFTSPEEAQEAYLTAKRKHHEGCTI